MAVSKLINSARLIEIPTTLHSHRIDVGVVRMRAQAAGFGWRLLAAAVRRYRMMSPQAKALSNALLVALGMLVLVLVIAFTD